MARKKAKPNPNPVPRPLESEVQSGILELLAALGIPHWRTNAGGGYRLGRGGKPQLIKAAPAGTPDVCGWIPLDGRFLGIEIKRPGERPTADQIAVMKRINTDGGVAFWCDSLSRCHQALAAVRRGAAVEMGESGEWTVSL